MTLPAKARPVFLSAILLLCLCAAASYLSFSYFRAGERWVLHTQEVRAVVGDVEAAVNRTARARTSYLLTGDANDLKDYRSGLEQIAAQLRALEELTGDNPQQRANIAQLEQVTQDRERAWEEAVTR